MGKIAAGIWPADGLTPGGIGDEQLVAGPITSYFEQFVEMQRPIGVRR